MTNQGSNLPGPNELLDAWRIMAADTEQRWNDYLNEVMGTSASSPAAAR